MRLRFAPSNTGELHIGVARVALFNYLLARKNGGEFIFRIEDTDRGRSTKESAKNIIEGLKFLGISWEIGPVYQSDRIKNHIDIALKLEKDGVFTRSSKGREDGAEALVFKFPPKDVVITDQIKGEIIKDKEYISNTGELVILRSDGTPTYNFSCVIDDHEMEVTDVVRGDDHIENTWKQILLYEVLGWIPPRFAHLPMILGDDGKPLSKRHGDTSISELQSKGMIRDAVVNYLALLGWSHPKEKEDLDMDELIESFSLERVSKSPAVFDEKKLLWINGIKIRKTDKAEWIKILNDYNKEYNIIQGLTITEEYYPAFVKSGDTLRDILTKMKILSYEGIEESEYIKSLGTDNNLKIFFNEIYNYFKGIDKINLQELQKVIKVVQDKTGIKGKEIYGPLRYFITGQTSGPELDKLIPLLDINIIIKRLDEIRRKSGI